jgi:hypothetical protein
MTKKIRLTAFLIALLSIGALAVPSTAEAQWYGRGYYGYGYGIGWYGAYGPWGGPWGPWGYPYYGGGWYYGASMRIQFDQKQAEVYVDGWRAGIVDDFDSWFQSLNLEPGGHEITLYLDGFKTQRHNLMFLQSSSQNLKGVMEKLGPGEVSGPRPQPAPQVERNQGGGMPPQRAPGAQYQMVPATSGQQDVVEEVPPRFGTLSLKVLPPDAEVIVDDQSWKTVGEQQILSIKLSAGRHNIEIKKEGYVSYVEVILIRSNATMNLNVGLTKKAD